MPASPSCHLARFYQRGFDNHHGRAEAWSVRRSNWGWCGRQGVYVRRRGVIGFGSVRPYLTAVAAVLLVTLVPTRHLHTGSVSARVSPSAGTPAQARTTQTTEA